MTYDDDEDEDGRQCGVLQLSMGVHGGADALRQQWPGSSISIPLIPGPELFTYRGTDTGFTNTT